MEKKSINEKAVGNCASESYSTTIFLEKPQKGVLIECLAIRLINQTTKTITTKTIMKMKTLLFAAAALVFPATAVADHHAKDKKPSKNVVQIAAGADDFSTLVTAVKAAGLAEALSGEGPFTIFAPTNAAFEKLPDGTVAALLKPEAKEKLGAILKYHVVAGKVMAADVKPGEVKTLNGEKVTIAVKDGKVMVDEATVVKTDIVGTNGVIHVIDSVILPGE